MAEEVFGEPPLLWGRYFTSTASSGTVEYRHLRENQPLRDRGIRVLPIARQTKRVDGSQAEGSEDAQQNADDLIATFTADYLASQGDSFLMFLDVEGAPPLSMAYYLGWATTLLSHSRVSTDGRVSLLPCVYGVQSDNQTWNSVKSACDRGATCAGAWIARWRVHGCNPQLDFDMSIVSPAVQLPCKILLWQYSDDCHGGDGFDCDQINPSIDLDADLVSRCILPPPSIM
ncbi:MAG: hypothetical protein JOZ42_01695 [Acetobacteraceae bacterium]|nr:hypothetical protein [Acetobacteraceae bacterium]